MQKSWYTKFVAYTIKHCLNDFGLHKAFLTSTFKTHGIEVFPASLHDVHSLAVNVSNEFPTMAKILK